jgi:hypothetical protein
MKVLPGAPPKTAKELVEKHRLKPYLNLGGRKFFNPRIHKIQPIKTAEMLVFCLGLTYDTEYAMLSVV